LASISRFSVAIEFPPFSSEISDGFCTTGGAVFTVISHHTVKFTMAIAALGFVDPVCIEPYTHGSLGSAYRYEGATTKYSLSKQEIEPERITDGE